MFRLNRTGTRKIPVMHKRLMKNKSDASVRRSSLVLKNGSIKVDPTIKTNSIMENPSKVLSGSQSLAKIGQNHIEVEIDIRLQNLKSRIIDFDLL